MRVLFEEIKKAMEAGEPTVLVTIISSTGSTPRGAGSRMLVRRDKSTLGTVGGGAVEYRAQQAALEVLRTGGSHTEGFSLSRAKTADIGMVCGGDVSVYFQYISPDNTAFSGLCDEILKALEKDEDSWLILDITDEACWQMGIYRKGFGITGMDRESREIPETREREWFTVQAGCREGGGRKYYIESLVQAGSVYVFGGGHVAQELVPLLSHVGFRCVVMDDRPEFANPRVFPDAVRTVVGDLEHIDRSVTVKPTDYVCIMTRGHQYDYYVQKQTLLCKPCYIGVMGSRNKIRVVTEKLLEDGFSREEIESCHMPIGTAILAETPAEIAVSIAGELIAVRAGRLGRA